ncbi:MAG: TetR/AcrR family transcriptional regulator [Myxococcota bacterium]|nr:TetR/AcrR family transcriptional regulator [Myxococcota bacterium]
MSGLRERNKARRRHAILESALELLRHNALEDVTIEQIAARAEVSSPTVYNLVGTREQLLGSLIDRVMEDLVATLEKREGELDPIDEARFAVEQSARAFVADGEAYRQIVRALGSFPASGSPLAVDPVQLHIQAMKGAQEMGTLRPELDPTALGRQSYIAYIAALIAWAAESLTDRGFLVAAHHGLMTVVAAAASDSHRDAFVAELSKLGRELGQASWKSR